MDYITKQIDWILPVIFIAIATAAEIWILVSLTHYGLKTKKWKKQNQEHVDKLNSRNQYTALVACAVFCVIYSLLSLIYISVGFHVDEGKLCDSLADAINVFYSFVQAAVYMFLWLRQRTFYANQLLNVTYSKLAKVFSIISVVFSSSAGSVVTVFLVYPNNRFSSLNGCVESANDAAVFAYNFGVFALFFGQTTLLGLFFYALTKTGNQEKSIFVRLLKDFCCCCCYKQNTNETTQTPENSTQNSAESSTSIVSSSAIISVSRAITHGGAQHSCFSKSSKSAENIRKVMRKTLLLAIISVVADLFTWLFVPYISNENFDHMRFIMLVANLNVLLNLVLLVFSFAIYRKMLSSPCRCWVA